MPEDVVPDVIEDGVPCLEELRGNGHLIVAEVASMVLRLAGLGCWVPGRQTMRLPDGSRGKNKKRLVVNTRQKFTVQSAKIS